MSEIQLMVLRPVDRTDRQLHPTLPWTDMKRSRDRAAALSHSNAVRVVIECDSGGGAMAKRFGRPSAQYRYEHYDPS